jgi:hypothetical protein
MSPFLISRGLATCAALVFAVPALAQNRFASNVVDFSPGPNFNPSFADPAKALGGPQGGGMSNGSLDMVVLGMGGSVTLGFDVVIVDGPGADFTVCENSFVFSGGVFAEVAFVEVSTDGLSFARFPTRYAGPVGPLPPFGVSPMGTFGGLCGGLPVIANVVTNSVSPFDPVVSGGESYDLAELASHPLVLSGVVDVDDINYVRIVDVIEGTSVDSFGALIWDHGGSTSSADIDAVSVIHYAGGVNPNGPIVDLSIDAQGYLVLELGDANGFLDVDLSTLTTSVNLAPSSFGAIRPLLKLQQRTATSVILRSKLPIVGSGVQMALGISVQDQAGNVSADQVILPG